jgi:hypothetical protein
MRDTTRQRAIAIVIPNVCPASSNDVFLERRLAMRTASRSRMAAR